MFFLASVSVFLLVKATVWPGLVHDLIESCKSLWLTDFASKRDGYRWCFFMSEFKLPDVRPVFILSKVPLCNWCQERLSQCEQTPRRRGNLTDLWSVITSISLSKKESSKTLADTSVSNEMSRLFGGRWGNKHLLRKEALMKFQATPSDRFVVISINTLQSQIEKSGATNYLRAREVHLLLFPTRLGWWLKSKTS